MAHAAPPLGTRRTRPSAAQAGSVAALTSVAGAMALSAAALGAACAPAPTRPRASTATPAAAPVPATPAKRAVAKWDLWSQGTRLRGANVWQKVIDPARDGDAFGSSAVGPPYERDELRDLARLGANYVNVSHPGIFSEQPPYDVVPAVEANLDRLLAAIEAADMFAVIAFRTGPGRNEAAFGHGGGDPLHRVWTDRAAQDAWAAMWRHAATRYRGRAVVAGYDLMVEPNANVAVLGKAKAVDWSGFAARMVAAIREVDRATPCLVEPMGFASVRRLAELTPPADPLTLLAVHVYDPHAFTHPKKGVAPAYPATFDVSGDGKADRVDRAWVHGLLEAAAVVAAKAHRPLAANEFGVTRWAKGGATYLRDVIDAFEGAGMNHAVWLWESRWPKIDYDAFNVRRGTDADAHADVPAGASNELLGALTEAWARNSIRPSSGVAPAE